MLNHRGEDLGEAAREHYGKAAVRSGTGRVARPGKGTLSWSTGRRDLDGTVGPSDPSC